MKKKKLVLYLKYHLTENIFTIGKAINASRTAAVFFFFLILVKTLSPEAIPKEFFWIFYQMFPHSPLDDSIQTSKNIP